MNYALLDLVQNRVREMKWAGGNVRVQDKRENEGSEIDDENEET